ncbi:hypothetical protein JGH11_13950 [Dysgonomonas sp. Marseille-P4677]|uniref:hypothetical protein n=1 Tax=Dysgonomonas sp. Marseille-P4677 TaxID=2364790 RepID=UPI001911BCC6|nr:hypothetical protein [Dysgonomonas sp. Marseille-P4677]MBK5721977.1 hypothetical protein [Dysgonomonas sp. Marseille-P4677]
MMIKRYHIGPLMHQLPLIALALIKLAQFVEEPKKSEYLDVAEKQLSMLDSPEYTAELGKMKSWL